MAIGEIHLENTKFNVKCELHIAQYTPEIDDTKYFALDNHTFWWAVVVAQWLTEQLLQTLEDPGSIPVIFNFYWTYNYWKLIK